MKHQRNNNALLLAVAVGCAALALGGGLCVGDEPKDSPLAPSPKAGGSKPETTDRTVEITGSHIRQGVKRTGQIVATPFPVVVIDRQTIERSGASDIRELLRKVPPTH